MVAVAVSTAVMVGAMLVGQSMRASLAKSSESRLGKVTHSLFAGDRFLSEDLQVRLKNRDEKSLYNGLIQLPGTLRNQESGRSLNRVTVNAVQVDFWKLGPQVVDFDTEGVWINENLSSRLGLKAGDAILLKLNTNPLSDSVMAQSEIELQAMELKVKGVLSEEQWGNFNLAANQLPPYNIFVPLEQVQDVLEKGARINLLLSNSSLEVEQLQKHLKESIDIDDLELRIEQVGDRLELRSRRIFLEEAIENFYEDDLELKLFTYLVNGVSYGKQMTPYPLIAGSDDRRFDLKEDEIVLTDWMANDLKVKVGESVVLNYFVLNDQNQLREKKESLKVKAIIPVESALLDDKMMPDYPGLKDSEHCRDWDVGFEIDLEKIRDKDEKYWDTYKGRPKAVMAYRKAQELWRNRYGDKTAIRFVENNRETLVKKIDQHLKPDQFGLVFMPIAKMSDQALSGSMDFSGLFMGFSFFICIAVLTLTYLLFKFLIEERKQQYHLLVALGFNYPFIRKQFFYEFMMISIPGAVLGVVAGSIYAGYLIEQLNSNWQDAIGQWNLFVTYDPVAMVTGALIGVILCLLILLLSLKVLKKSIFLFSKPELLVYRQSKLWHTYLRWLCYVGALLMAVRLFLLSDQAPKLEFFLFGALLLGSALMTCLKVLALKSQGHASGFSRWAFAVSQMGRRKGRSLAVIMMLSCGAFMMISLEVFRMAPDVDTQLKHSGSGGFQLLIDLTRPLDRDLNFTETQKRFALNKELCDQAVFTSLRLSPGEDASCLNLNRAQRPNLIGIPSESFAKDQRFSFASMLDDGLNSPWLQLKQDLGPGKVPVIGDHNALLYSLGENIGDHLTLVDESGKELQLVVVGGIKNSIFQSSLLMDESQLLKYFPSVSGFKNILVECSDESIQSLKRELNEGMEILGADVISTQDKMMSYNRVQNSYISIFQTLGLLGLVLGCSGLCLVVMHNINDRKKDFAVFQALGQTLKRIQTDLVKEHMVLFVVGLLSGFLSGLLATWPILTSGMGNLQVVTILMWMGLMLLIGMVSIVFGYRFAAGQLSITQDQG